MSHYLAVAFGGAAGAMARFGISTSFDQWWPGTWPIATFTVNVTGCLLAGFLSIALLDRIDLNEAWRLGLMIGFLGSFTTFSSFALDNLKLADAGGGLAAFGYSLASLCASVGAAWLGIQIAKQVI